MRTTLAALLLLPVALLAACGTETGGTAADDTEPAASASPMPTEMPVPAGPVRTLHLATVMDTGDGPPQLCLGPIAESYPPQCSGLPMAGWRWADQQGVFEREGKVRWGLFSVTGTFDGETFTVTDSVPGALYDPMVGEPSEPPSPSASHSEEELQRIVEEVMDLPGAQSASSMDGRVIVDVVHDDGSLQAWADEEHGAHAVHVVSLLVPVG